MRSSILHNTREQFTFSWLGVQKNLDIFYYSVNHKISDYNTKIYLTDI